MSNFKLTFLFLITLLQTNFAFSEIKVLLLDGQNNHNWKATTPVIVEALERDNFSKVTVSTSPRKSLLRMRGRHGSRIFKTMMLRSLTIMVRCGQRMCRKN